MGGEYFRAEGLRKSWPMKEVSLSVSMEKGEALALLGPSGCGKSSILRMIAGLLAPDEGRIYLNGIDIASLAAGRRNVGMVFQDHALFPHLSVEDNIGYGLISQGRTKRQSRVEASTWLDTLGLSGFAKRKIESLSGGEKQRVSLARTLIVNPALVLFDEPLSSLDAELRERLQRELRVRQKELGYTAVYVTHDENEAAVLADRVIRMR
jgi:thiamine transport system ATP-binding protein